MRRSSEERSTRGRNRLAAKALARRIRIRRGAPRASVGRWTKSAPLFVARLIFLRAGVFVHSFSNLKFVRPRRRPLQEQLQDGHLKVAVTKAIATTGPSQPSGHPV